LELEEDSEEINMGGDDIDMEAEDVDIEGSNPISRLPKYIPLRRGKAKVPKEIDEIKAMLHTLLLPDKIAFHRLCLASLLKMEDYIWLTQSDFPS